MSIGQVRGGSHNGTVLVGFPQYSRVGARRLGSVGIGRGIQTPGNLPYPGDRVPPSLVPRRYAGTPARHFYDVLAVANAPEPSLKLGDACGEGGGNRVSVFEPSLREFEAGGDRPA